MKEISEEKEFDSLMKSSTLVLVDFYADWCLPCQALKPILEKIEKEYKNVKMAKVNIEKNKELASKFSIMSIPTLILFKNGKEIDRIIGLMPENAIREWLEKNK